MREQSKLEEGKEELLMKRGFEIKQLVEKNVDAIPRMLTDNELEILSILLHEEKPLNTLNIRDKFRDFKYGNSANSEAIKRYLAQKKADKKMTERWYEKIPSYEKIESDLLSLEVLGIVSKREDELKKSKYLWFITPNFFTNWMERRKNLLDEIKKDKTGIVETHGKRLLDFYLIQANREERGQFDNRVVAWYFTKYTEERNKNLGLLITIKKFNKQKQEQEIKKRIM